ncbi:chemotaxis protein CheB [Actinoplanes utahensis]|uniref:protein-glutamate methylesterase n=1 Tax=Actinoplanes utahensis TaxID=1869 RepID=A0A0A6UN78_ACTUT|nr:chemotaxis protein CheB [Actinoplanes utahensis]KHD76856.1 chemotaxis protein CheB [Actinoplanes utahensis]GIF33365.1 chemotaxis protein CheB [Actinoplanes utahensis]
MMRRDVVVIGGSAGSHKALTQVLARLPADLPAAVLVALHMAPGARAALARSLASSCALPVRAAVDGGRLEPGCVQVAVPDRHLIVDEDDVLRLSDGPRQNRVRPAADALFRSAARWCGPRVVGMVLSGSLDDGAAGLAAIVSDGGIGLVQDPAEARFPGMPTAALRVVPDAMTATAFDLGDAVAKMAGNPVIAASRPPTPLIWETDMIAYGASNTADRGQAVGLGCPDCGGGMYLVRTGLAAHYVCHVGHSYSPQSLLAVRDDGIEGAIWTAVSALQEKVMVIEELVSQSEKTGDAVAAAAFRAEAERAGRAATVLQEHVNRSAPAGR